MPLSYYDVRKISEDTIKGVRELVNDTLVKIAIGIFVYKSVSYGIKYYQNKKYYY